MNAGALANEGVVYLVRHGEVHNPHGVRYGRLPGYGIAAAGVEQARCAAVWLRENADPPVGSVRSSPLLRARETAAVLRDALTPGEEITTVEALTELRSPFDGLPRKSPPGAYLRRLVAAFPAGFSTWERHGDAASRMLAAVRDAARDAAQAGRSVVLVSHQAPIWLASLAVEQEVGDGRARVTRWRSGGSMPAYASVTEVRFCVSDGAGARARVRYVDCAG
jgi:broad specificity phosphatase PhoE